MFLKTLSIRGFKSFADRALLEFEPGITVVVGPNGSGKSNVVDAIAWVLGAQAPSAIRSQKMDDVIFAGTSARSALGRAEVSLTIDNTAGLLPVEFTEVTISRTLFRSGDSDYALNGVPCRLLDIQELLSDAGVGRNQHVIVSQGQIDAVLNARPEERRTIIEEAAGILKYRRRRERAERRLTATEGDLHRVADLLREIRRQLRPLEKQAAAAERHTSLVAELDGVRRHLAARDLAELHRRIDALAARRAHLAEEIAGQEAALGSLDADIAGTEEDLRRHGGRAVGELIAQLSTARERGRGLLAVIEERRRGLERILSLRADADPVEAIEAERADVAAELAAVAAALADAEPRRDEAAADESAVVAEREALLAPAEGTDPLARRAVEVRRQLAGLRAGLERSGGELGRLRERLDRVEDRGGQLAAEIARHDAALDAAEAAEDDLLHAVAAAEEARAGAEEEVTAAEEDLRSAEGEHRSWRARAEALAEALEGARARAGAARLGDVRGVLGTLLDVVHVDPGWEAAFEAAAGEALAAVVVDGPDAARAGLEVLAEGGGAVLPAAVPGTEEAPGTGEAPAPTSGARLAGEPVRAHVRAADPNVERLLDRILARAVAVPGGWAAAFDVAVAHPDLVVVTAAGDRFGSEGWRVGTARTGVTGAMVEEARAAAHAAAGRIGPARERLETARSSARHHRAAHEQAVRAADEHAARARAAGAARERAQRALGEAHAEVAQVQDQITALEERQAAETARVADLDAQLPALEAAEADEAARAEARAAAEADLERRRSDASRRRMELEVTVARLAQRRQLLSDRDRDLDRRLEATRRSRDEAETERVRAGERIVVIERLHRVVADRLACADGALAALEEERRRLSAASRELGARLDDLRRRRDATSRRLAAAAESAQKAELEAAELTVRLESLGERIRRELDTDAEALGDAPAPELPEGVSVEARARDLEAELRTLGPINPLAVEEHAALRERHELIETQLDDVKATRRELHKVIAAIDEEIVGTFAAAFADVSTHFSHLFATLFPGGTGALRLTTPDDLLNTGIEVEARPSGKNVRKLSLLSGGERALTALGLLFAIFRSRPSPFYVMDEVEAALDDINLRRFLDLLEEFRREAQLIIVSHQKRTMEVADCLYGVTMKPGESSRVVSERLRSA